jgi:hypothetical protein
MEHQDRHSRPFTQPRVGEWDGCSEIQRFHSSLPCSTWNAEMLSMTEGSSRSFAGNSAADGRNGAEEGRLWFPEVERFPRTSPANLRNVGVRSTLANARREGSSTRKPSGAPFHVEHMALMCHRECRRPRGCFSARPCGGGSRGTVDQRAANGGFRPKQRST